MSKEIAQTVGGKRIAWLVAILAAFAVFATVGSQFRSAEATVSPASYTLSGPYTALAACNTVPASGPALTSPQAYGAAAYYCASVTADTTLTNPVVITVTAPAGVTITSITPTVGPVPTCTAPTAGPGNSVTCTYTGLTATSTYGLGIATTLQANVAAGVGGATTAGAMNATADDQAAQPAVPFGVNGTTLMVVNAANLQAAKAHTPSGNPAPGTNVTYTITVTNPTSTTFTAVSAANVHVVDTIQASGFASIQSVTAAGGTVNTCTGVGPFPDTTPPYTFDCNIGTLAVGATATVTVVGTVVTPAAATPPTVVTVSNFATATADNGPTATSNTDTFTVTGAALVVAPLLALCPGLFHLDAAGNLLIDTSPTGIDPGPDATLGTADDCRKALRDTDNNVVGFNHVVVFVPARGVTGGLVIATPTAVIPPAVTLTGSQTAFRIDTVSGTPNVNGQNLQTVTPLNAALFSNPTPFTAVQWYSTGPGEQNITVIDSAGSVVADFADGPTNGADVALGGITGGLTPLVKEWNILVPTTITAAPTTASAAVGLVPARTAAENALLGNAVNLDATQGTLPVTLNPATGAYFSSKGASVYENVLAQHTNASGIQTFFAQGARVTFTKTGTCGSFTLTGGFVTGATGIFAVNNPTNGSVAVTTSTTVVTTGAPIQVTLNTASDCVLLGGATIGFTAQAAYPNNLGSNTPTVALEKYEVRLTATIATKQVFLAWAGQRIILEHDWRLPPGDLNNSIPVGTCPIPNTPVTYIKGTGPGNFIPGLGATISGNDQATVVVYPPNSIPGQLSDAPLFPQMACISRVLYESEDPGEVDIEAFVNGPANNNGSNLPNATKVAFVVYYMKLNTVNVSLATQVSKPTHNNSLGVVVGVSGVSANDYAPGNPWDASKDAASKAADWNVSRDLLVRGRITGWFLNSNPSGRAADTSNPLNVLPANRWVMPNDWALLAGGPADKADNSPSIGTAEAFRPEYDIMINPGRGTRGLDTPEGTFLSAAATLGADLAATTNTVVIKLPASPIAAGATIRIDNEDMTVVTAPVANALGTLGTMTVTRGVNATTVAAHTTGAIVLIRSAVSTPFEGPFSLIDLAALGSSAALSSFAPGSIRDTVFKDGDVDWWDAPMPPALTTVDIRGTGFIKQVLKQDVYYTGTPNVSLSQTYPNPFYISNIPDSPYIPAVVAGGGFYWDSWGNDGELAASGQGAYRFWQPIPTLIAAVPGQNPVGTTDTSVSAAQLTELTAIRTAYTDNTIGRTLVVYSDNHGEFMVTANGDFKTDLTACATNTLAGGKHCKPGDKVGTGSIYATADYPDFRGKHFPVMSNTATVTWTWGGYKDVTVEKGETDQFKYVVFHALDRDGFCSAASFGAISLHPVLSGAPNDAFNGAPKETVDFLIDSGQGIIIGTSGGATTGVNDGKQFATGLTTYSTLVNDPLITGIQEFPNSPLAAAGAVDECQAWIKVSNSLLGVLNVLAIAHNDEGNVGFDKIIDLTNTTSYTLNFRWSLVTWAGADGISINDAIKGTGTTGKNPGGNDISASVTAIYGWDQAAQQWLGFFPTGVNVPGANDLTSLKTGQAFWIAITGPGSVTWTVASNVN